VSRLYVNGRFLGQPLSGMQRYAEELLIALDDCLDHVPRRIKGIESIEILVPSGEIRRHEWRNLKIRQIGSLHGHAWEQVELAWAARDGFLLNLTSCGPLLHRNSVLVMHDAAIFAHPEHFSRSYRLWHRFLRPRLARGAVALITISAFSMKELARWCKVPEESFKIIGDSAEHIIHVESDESILRRHGLQKGAYALTVGNQSPNKNIALAIRSFEKAALSGWILAVAGGGSESIFGATDTRLSSNIRRLGRVTDSELRALYENAGLFLFPSRYEGFGVPPLEAMTLGCPVISSNSSAMPEILGKAAVYFKCDDMEDFARQIVRLAADPTARASYKAAGRERAAIYSWAKCGTELISVLERLHEGRQA
jgi:glycosyltransferase involved in cell wall biosynthesis